MNRLLAAVAIRSCVQFALLALCVSNGWHINLAMGDWQGPRRDIVSLPDKGVKPSGFLMTVACDDVRLFGDMPTAISIVPTGSSFPADRKLWVRILPVGNSTQPPGRDCIYEIPLQLSQGATRFEQTFYLPKWSVGGELEISVLEDRRVIDGYQGRIAGERYFPSQADSCFRESAEQRFGWIIDDQLDTSDAKILMATIAPELMNVSDAETSPAGFEFGETWRQFRTVSVSQLPQDWRGFDAVDVWIVRPETLRELFNLRPESATALREYLRCGGSLWIVGAFTDSEVSERFQLAQLNPIESRKFIEPRVQLSQSPIDYNLFRATTYAQNIGARSYIRQHALVQSGVVSYQSSQVGGVNAVDATFDKNLAWFATQESAGNLAPVTTDDFSVHTVAMGKIIVCRKANAVPGTPQQWRILAALTGSNVSEISRRAVDPCFGDIRFWDWIIPGVAQPPVYTFIGLLTVFVIIVGPVAYRRFTRLGRGYLMMFVAPVLALAATLIMFAYGLVADGLSTRARIREVSWIGDQSGDASRYCRASYFAGVRPSDGMRIPDNSILLPYQLPSSESWYDASQRDHSTIGTIEFENESMHLDRGFLPSRQQKQFVTYRPVKNFGGVRLQSTDQQLTLISELAIDLRNGVLADRTGKVYEFKKLASNSETTLQLIEKSRSGELLSDLYGLQRPIPPAAISSSRRSGEQTIDLVSQLNSQIQNTGIYRTNATVSESVVESWLRNTLQIGSELPPGMFIAIADVTEDCIAVPDVEIVESVHYVVGVLP